MINSGANAFTGGRFRRNFLTAPVRTSIAQYTSTELIRLLRWIASDGQLRTDDQIVDEMVAVLGFSRSGVRIERAIHSAINVLAATSIGFCCQTI